MSYSMDNTFKKRFFINIQIAQKDINVSTKNRKRVLDSMIASQNVLQEAYYKYEDAFEDFYISEESMQCFFSRVQKNLSCTLKNFKAYVKTEISLKQALEFMAFGWEPTDEYGEAFQKRKRYYITDPCSKKGREQIANLEDAATQLECLFIKGLHFFVKTKTEYKRDVNFSPKVSIANKTQFILTNTEKGESYDDIIINYSELSEAFDAAKEIHQNNYTLQIINHVLFLIENGKKHKVQRFSVLNRGRKINKKELIFQYILARPYKRIYWKEMCEKEPDLCSGEGTNFNNMIQTLDKGNFRKAVKKYFFKPFKASVVRYESVIHDFPSSLID